MKKAKKHDPSVKAIVRDRKAKQYQADSQSSGTGLICESDKKVDEESRGLTKHVSYTSTSDFVILVRESPKPLNYVQGMISSSEESMKKNFEDTSYRPTNDVKLYPELTTSAKTGHHEGQNGEQAEFSDTENETKKENDVDITDYKPKGKQLLYTENTYPRKEKGRFAMLRQRSHMMNIYGCQFRCLLYFSVACCASILFACLLTYLSYPN